MDASTGTIQRAATLLECSRMAKTSVSGASGEAAAQQILGGAEVASIDHHELLGAIEALVQLKSVEAADALARIEAPKDAAKAARRGLFRLQSQGIRPTPVESVAEAPARATAKTKLVDAHISSYDPRGTRAIFVLAEKPFSGLISFFVIASDSEGVLDAELTSTTKKSYFARMQNFEAQYDYIQFVSLPPEYALHVIHKLAALNEKHEHHHPLPQDYSMWSTVAADVPQWEGLPPVYSELKADDIRQQVPLEDTRELASTEFAGWVYDQEQLKEHIARIETARGGPLVVSSDAQKGREAAIADEATDAIFQGDELARAKERLEETAYLLLHQGSSEAASRCLRAALAVDDTVPHEQPFLRQLLVKSLELATEGGLPAEEEEPLAPEAARTESGIILPA